MALIANKLNLASPITTVPIPELLSSSPLAISYARTTDSFHAYYTGADTQMYEFIASNASSPDFPTAASSGGSGGTGVGWTNTSDFDNSWIKSQGPGAPVASISWTDQVAFFQMLDVGLVQSTLNTTSGAWKAPFII
jgi:hypothetical protein